MFTLNNLTYCRIAHFLTLHDNCMLARTCRFMNTKFEKNKYKLADKFQGQLVRVQDVEMFNLIVSSKKIDYGALWPQARYPEIIKIIAKNMPSCVEHFHYALMQNDYIWVKQLLNRITDFRIKYTYIVNDLKMLELVKNIDCNVFWRDISQNADTITTNWLRANGKYLVPRNKPTRNEFLHKITLEQLNNCKHINWHQVARYNKNNLEMVKLAIEKGATNYVSVIENTNNYEVAEYLCNYDEIPYLTISQHCRRGNYHICQLLLKRGKYCNFCYGQNHK